MPALIENPLKSDIDASGKPLSTEESTALFDATARQYLGMSGEDFLSAWDAQRLDPHESKVMRVAVLIPLVRRTCAGKKSL